MGKLHTIRRAIERDPAAWIDSRGRARAAFPAHHYVRGRPLITAGWYPSSYGLSGPANYRSFVRSVLRELGYNVT